MEVRYIHLLINLFQKMQTLTIFQKLTNNAEEKKLRNKKKNHCAIYPALSSAYHSLNTQPTVRAFNSRCESSVHGSRSRDWNTLLQWCLSIVEPLVDTTIAIRPHVLVFNPSKYSREDWLAQLDTLRSPQHKIGLRLQNLALEFQNWTREVARNLKNLTWQNKQNMIS